MLEKSFWHDYVSSALRTSWQPAAFIPKKPPRLAPDENIIDWCRVGQQNEADSINLFQAASCVATSEGWQIFAPLWLQDEMRHSEAFHRMGAYLGLPDRWVDSFIPSVEVVQMREKFYRCLFKSELHVWAALAIDEWNTRREYLEDGVADFEAYGLSKMMRLLSRDETRHHVFALKALQTHPDRQAAKAAVEDVVAIATTTDSFQQFLFDQWDLNNAKRTPGNALDVIMQTLEKEV
ncbi:MAG: ferritin-like domain-containing protein [Oscillatoria sp. PMC 1051.18]|nr:ferritin-like domain-containing protein [Oscillatoria sp. PMC 1050.18]MEC5028926.1 ferritin-like domain-containing protein [Oscillatoria sp. PMC 1051.18]